MGQSAIMPGFGACTRRRFWSRGLAAAGLVLSASASSRRVLGWSGDEEGAAVVASSHAEAALRDRVGDAPHEPLEEARTWIVRAKSRYESVRDFTCILHKQERVKGRLTGQQVLKLKVRTNPKAVYVKYLKPHAGREAIFVDGKHQNKLLVHDVGIGKLLAGTLQLDPKGHHAMQDTRHPITEASLGHMIDTIHDAWQRELRPGEMWVDLNHQARVGDRGCTLIETAHRKRYAGDMYYGVKVYIDKELILPIRFEAYDWPAKEGGTPELAEMFTYQDLKLDVGLTDHDFDPANSAYDFGRF